MTMWQVVVLSAGTLIVVSLALGLRCSPLHVSGWWPAVTAFIGLATRADGLKE